VRRLRPHAQGLDIEDVNLDELIATALDDPEALTGEIKAFRGINFADLHIAYRQFCKNEKVPKPAVDLGEVIDFYNKAAVDLPDHAKLLGFKLPGASVVLDGKGARFADVFEENQRRLWVALGDIPEQVQKAFIAAEDKRFYAHKGVDERGLIRAFIGNLAGSGRPQGGSTITQQVVKNLLVGENLTYERKIREMIVASRLERALSKDEILELYLNFVFLGRGARNRDGGADLLPSRRGAHARALLAGADQGAELPQPRPPSRAGAGAARLCVQPPAGGRRHRARAGRQAPAVIAGARRLPAAPRHRLPLRRSGRPRGQGGGRHRGDHRQLLYGALDHQHPIAAGRRGDAAGGPVALRAQCRPGPVPQRRGESRPGRATDRGGQEDAAAPGSGRSPRPAPLYDALDPGVRGKGAARRARRGASVSPTGASCRSRSTTAPPSASLRFTTWSSSR
jgi:hypothetical protein